MLFYRSLFNIICTCMLIRQRQVYQIRQEASMYDCPFHIFDNNDLITIKYVKCVRWNGVVIIILMAAATWSINRIWIKELHFQKATNRCEISVCVFLLWLIALESYQGNIHTKMIKSCSEQVIWYLNSLHSVIKLDCQQIEHVNTSHNKTRVMVQI